MGFIETKQAMPAKEILRRPEFKIENLPDRFFTPAPKKITTWLYKEILEDVEAEIKYEGYIKRHLKEIEKLSSSENLRIPKNTDFFKIKGLSNEAKEKLNNIKPETLGQAMRTSGIKPAESSVLLINFFTKK